MAEHLLEVGKVLSGGPLRTKEELRNSLKQLLKPVRPSYSPGCARLELRGNGAAYPPNVSGFEGYSRLLWGLVPLLAGGGEDDSWEQQLTGLRNGTNPEHEEYWGTISDYDQRMVEMAAIGLALCLIPERIWEPLSERERQRLGGWLSQINERKLWDCNWLFFVVMVNMGLQRVGYPHNQTRMEECLRSLDTFYIGDGWYEDGKGGHCDYYTPFAFQYYGLVYAALMEAQDPIRCQLYKERAILFAHQFIHWFGPDGSALPYGRSLTYRFAQAAFWSAAIYAGIEPYPLGVMKGLLLRNLRWWLEQPIFGPDGVMSVGYSYPNLVMGENYNGPGSPYWSLKTYLPLALADSHPFWTEPELPYPSLESCVVLPHPHLVICRQSGDAGDPGHFAAFNTGHLSSNEHTHTSAKYEKFVYSNRFAFSVPRAEWGLGQGAFDNMLALSESGDNLYRVKRKNEAFFIDEERQVLMMLWRPWASVSVRTWLLPGLPWHVRIHAITTDRPLTAADGGFALGVDRDYAQDQSPMWQRTTEVYKQTRYGTCGAKLLYGSGESKLIYPNANTNLMVHRTVIPTLVLPSIMPGVTWLATAFYGEPGLPYEGEARTGFTAGEMPPMGGEAPFAAVQGSRLIVYRGDQSEWFSVEMWEE